MSDSRLPGIDPKLSGCFPGIGVWSMGDDPAGAPDETEQAGRKNALWALNRRGSQGERYGPLDKESPTISGKNTIALFNRADERLQCRAELQTAAGAGHFQLWRAG